MSRVKSRRVAHAYASGVNYEGPRHLMADDVMRSPVVAGKATVFSRLTMSPVLCIVIEFKLDIFKKVEYFSVYASCAARHVCLSVIGRSPKHVIILQVISGC